METEELEAQARAAHERTQRLKAEYDRALEEERALYLRLGEHGLKPAALGRAVGMHRVTVAKMVRLARAEQARQP